MLYIYILCVWLLLLFFNNSRDLFFFFLFFFFFSLILYFWKSNLYSRFLIFAFWYFVVNFVHLKTQSSAPSFTWEQDYWLDHSPLLWTLLFLHQVSSVSSLPLLFSTQPCETLCVLGRTLRKLVTGQISLSPFHFPLLSSWPPLSTSSLSSSLYNSMNTSEWSRLWSVHKDVITG